MNLSPRRIEERFRASDFEALDALMVDLCIGCGSCSYVCPAARSLAGSVRLARAAVRAERARGGLK